MGERTAPSGDDDRLLIALAAGLRVSADAADAGRGGARSGGGASDGGSDAAWSDAPPDGDGEPEAQLAKRPPHPRPTSLLDSGWSGYSASLPPEAAAPASDPWRAAFGAGGGLPRPMRTFPAPSPAADVAPLSAPAPPSELLFPAIARFFEVFHPLFPVVHKATFEASLAGQPSPVYAGTRPLALAYAAAAVGAFHLPAEPEQARVRFARLCCDRARDLLLAGRASPVEEAFALALILNVMLVAGVPGRMAHPLQRCGRLAEALYLSLPEEPPSTPDEWVYREQVLRLRIFYCAFDLGAAFNAGRPALSSYFHPHRSPLPCGEAFFDHPFPGAAFDALTSWRESEGGEPCVRYPAKDWREISGTFSHLSSLSASPSGSVLCALMLSNYVRHLRMALGRSDVLWGRAAFGQGEVGVVCGGQGRTGVSGEPGLGGL
ncbi:hypothetical protein DFJ74DRAFT_248605 [Hyaloraphidium curvatum]|nr:hypothetical protein DFJ74DRAFT_248605 [Hyaloraphidium curvatum]